MTVPDYLFGTGIRLSSDARLKAYLDYLRQLVQFVYDDIPPGLLEHQDVRTYDEYIEWASDNGYSPYGPPPPPPT